jgi:hypothetical protein
MKLPIMFAVAFTICLPLCSVSLVQDFASTSARTIHSIHSGCSITLPDGWVEIPDGEVQKTYTDAMSVTTSPCSLTWDLACQPQGQSDWFSYPYVLVQVKPYVNGQEPNEEQIQADVKGIAGLDLNKTIRDTFDSKAAGLMTNGSVGKSRWDDCTKTLIVPMQMMPPVEGLSKYFWPLIMVEVQSFLSIATRWRRILIISRTPFIRSSIRLSSI